MNSSVTSQYSQEDDIQSLNSSHSVPMYDVVIKALFAISDVVGVIFNLLSVAALIYSRHLFKKPFTILLTNLALTDLLFSISATLERIVGYMCDLQYSCIKKTTGICLVRNVIMLAMGIDWWTIMVIALERYVVVCKVTYYQHIFTLQKTFFLLVGFWFVGISFTLLPHIGDVHILKYGYKCSSKIIRYEKAPMAIFNAVFSGIPFLGIMVCYCGIYKKMKKYSKWRKTSSGNIPAFVKHNEKELTKTSLLVVFVYFFCVVSYMVILSIIIFSRNSYIDKKNKMLLANISILIFKQIF